MKRARILFYALIGIVCAFTAASLAQNASAQKSSRNEAAKRFIGMWRLVSNVDSQGQPIGGPHPTGFIVYDMSGNMAVQIMPDRARPKWTGPPINGAATPKPDEAAAALTGYAAYFGTWTVDERAQTVTHHLIGSVNPGNIGVDNVRKYEFGSSDRVTLIPIAPIKRGNRLTWERVK
jgi:hypothetical protein